MAITIMESTAGPIASKLMEIGAIRLNHQKPFTWSSGWRSPIYCDNRLSLSYPDVRSYVKRCLAQAVKDNFGQPDVIAGVATAGIPQGALVAEELQLPFAYVRPKPKDHGMENLIEGKIEKGQNVVLVEDLISTGGSSLKAANALRDAGAKVKGMVAIFTYGFDTAEKNFEKEKVDLVCLSDFNHLLQEALQKKFINEEQLIYIKAWRLDPGNWK
ncbi:MAG TPA: orotate phosphoribosyltransferase [Cyclobacteriaceae bacterium]|nr:orotate phosphoribosyltransferase [Cyclobacteriaceae bacterium]